ncbi:MAG: hypothetical protein ACR2ML_03515 [Solirubrobacteraceae bacterium]
MTMTLDDAQGRVERMVAAGTSFEVVEVFVESAPLPQMQKAALWLLAWSSQDPRTQLRVAKEALAQAAA